MANQRLSLAWLKKVQPSETKATQHNRSKSIRAAIENLAKQTEHIGPELEQILLRVRLDRLMTARTIDTQNMYLSGLEAVIKDLGRSRKQALVFLTDLRTNYLTRIKTYRENPFYIMFPHFVNEGDEHTNLFLQNIVQTHIMYPTRHANIERLMVEDEIKEMTRADKLALRVVQLTDSMYSVLMLRRLFMDYGITMTAKIQEEGEEGEEEEGEEKKSLHHDLDESSLVKNLSTKDPYIELANEAMLCANHIENGIAQQSNPTMTMDELIQQPGEAWQGHAPSIEQDFYSDYVEIFDSDSNSTKYSKSRNFLVETGLTGSEGDVGDIVYLKELLCHTLAAVKVKRYGKYKRSQMQNGHFCSYSFDRFADDRERIPRPNVEDSDAGFFGERLPCPHTNCGKSTKSSTKSSSSSSSSNSNNNHNLPPSQLYCRREWYYRAGVDLSVSPQAKRLNSERNEQEFHQMSSSTRYSSRVICKSCMVQKNIPLNDNRYLQSGYHVVRSLSKTVQLMQNLMEGRVVRHSHQHQLDPNNQEDGKNNSNNEEVQGKRSTLNPCDGGLLFAMIRAKTSWKKLVENNGHPDEIAIAEANYLKLARETSEVASSELGTNDQKKQREHESTTMKYGSFFQNNNLIDKLKHSSGHGGADGADGGMGYLFHESSNSSGYNTLMGVLDDIRSEQEDTHNAYKGELLLGKLRELDRKKLLQSNVLTHENDPLFAKEEDADCNAGDMSSDNSDYDDSNHVATEEKNNNEMATMWTNNQKTKSTKKSRKKKNKAPPQVLDLTVEPLQAKQLGLDIALHTENGQELLKEAFHLLKTKKVDHFGKKISGQIWPNEMRKVLQENKAVLSNQRVKPSHNAVMWQLRDGFERFEEACYASQMDLSSASSSSDDGDSGNSGNSNLTQSAAVLEEGSTNITRRSFDSYFGHIFTMSNKKDWNTSLHIDYLELMVEALLKTR